MTTINPSPNPSPTGDTTPDATYVDPAGVIYVLEPNPASTSPDDAATVTQYRTDRTRTVAAGPTTVLRAMLANWAETEGGALG